MNNKQIFYLTFCKKFFILLFFTLILQSCAGKRSNSKGAYSQPMCHFPQSEIDSFFFDIYSDITPDSIIVDTVVEPPNANLRIENIRSNNFPQVDFLEYFEVESQSLGQFYLISKKEFQFPLYPSKINETLLYITINCNGVNFPLITLRIQNANKYAPEFINQPYEMTILKNSLIGTQYMTPILAVDNDPAESYTLKFSIESGAQDQLAIVSEKKKNFDLIKSLPKSYSKNESDWEEENLPHSIQLKVIGPLIRSVYYLNVIVTDGGLPEQKTNTQLKVSVKHEDEIVAKFMQKEYFVNFTKDSEVNSNLIPDHQIFAVFPLNNLRLQKVFYELVDSEWSDLVSIDTLSARMRLYRPIPHDNVPKTIRLQIKAYVQSDPNNFVLADLILNDITEVKLTYFTQCHYEVYLMENPSTFTRVLQFKFNGDVNGVELLNGTKYFEVNSEGTVIVKFGAEINREKIEKIIIQAKLKNSSVIHPKSLELCQIATADIIIDDFNEYTPKFDKISYHFYLDLLPYNNTEVGTLHATDNDKGKFGQVKYRILTDENESLPFVLFQAVNSSILYYSTKDENFYPEKIYTFTIEAYDAEIDPRTSRVSVQVLLESDAEIKQRQREKEERNTKPLIEEIQDDDANFADNKRLGPTTIQSTILSKSQKQQQRFRAHHSKQIEIDEKSKTNILKSLTRERKSSIEIEQDDAELEQSEEKISSNHQQYETMPSKIYFKQLDLAAAAANASGRHSKNPKIVQHSTKLAVPNDKSLIAELVKIESGLKFETDKYNFSLKGRLDVGDFIGMVSVIKQRNNSDMFYNSSLRLVESVKNIEYIVEEGIIGFVDIDPVSGKLSVAKKLTEDSYEEIRFSVAAQDNNRKIVATALVTVFMDDVASIYDVNPVYEKAFYTFEIDENQIFEGFGRVKAHHKAAEQRDAKDHLWYVFNRHSPDATYFRINPENGWLSNRVPFDAESQKQYSFKISACLETNTTLCDFTDVIVVIRDVNDNYPQFNKLSYDINIPLNLPANTELLRLTATDKDSGLNAKIEYSMRTPESFQDLFEINSKTGVISLAKRLGTNFVNIADGLEYRVDVDAQDHGDPPMRSNVSVFFHTADINPSSPVFQKFRYEVTFDSPIPNNTEIIQVHAIDLDPGLDGQVEYRFAESDRQTNAIVSKQFLIDQITGKIRAFTIVKPPLSMLSSNEIDDINESKTLSNDFTIQLVVEAFDKSLIFPRKSQTVVVLHLRPSKHRELSEIEFIPLPKTIIISSAKSIGANVLKASIRAKEGSMLFSSNHIEYTVEEETGNFDYFEMHSNQMVIKRSLEPNEFDIRIRARLFNSIKTHFTNDEKESDKEFVEVSHQIHVVIIKNRDKYPVFDKLSYDIKVDSSSQFPIKIPSLNASLLNGSLEYFVYSSNNNFSIENFIVVDKITGEFTIFEELLKVLESENFESNVIEKFLVVRAQNADFPKFYSDASVCLQVLNRQNPQFTFDSQLYRFFARENLSVGSVIDSALLGIRQNKNKNLIKPLNIRYFFKPASQFFDVLPNGSIIVTNQLNLEELVADGVANSNGVVDLNVIAENKESMAKSKVEIAIIENTEYAPVFKKLEYIFQIDSPPKIGDTIGQVTAKDRNLIDQAGLRYQIVSGNALNYLSIDNRGKLLKNSSNEFESGKTYNFIVEVMDSGGLKNMAQVTFVANFLKTDSIQTKPESSKFQFFKNSNDSSGMIFVNLAELGSKNPIYRVKAGIVGEKESLPSSIFYSINNDISAEIDQSKLFKINSQTGDVFVDYDKFLARMSAVSIENEEFELLIEATHNVSGESIQKIFIIRFVDNNNVTSQYQQRKMTQVDKNKSPSIKKISTTAVQYKLSSTMIPELASVLKAPQFESTKFKFVIKNPQNNQIVGRLSLRNESATANNRPVQMFVDPPQFRNYFIVDSRTSLLYIRQVPFNLTGRQRAEFSVVVQDATNLQLWSKCNVIVDLVLPKINASSIVNSTQISVDRELLFTNSPPTLLVTSNTIFGNDFSVDNVNTAIKQESSLQSTTEIVEKNLSSTDNDSTFVIEETRTTLSDVDFPITLTSNKITDKNQNFTPPITTTLPNKSLTNEKIVEDSLRKHEERNVALQFKHTLYTTMLSEGNYGSRGALVSLKPDPLRQGMPKGTNYFIVSEDPTLPFYVRNDTGDLIAFAEIDREKIDRYQFKVIALLKNLNGMDNLRAETNVKVTVLDVNDNSPQFVDSENMARVIGIDSLMKVDVKLAQFNATDADEGKQGRVSFRLDENPNEMFKIGEQTGKLVLAKAVSTDLFNNSFYITIVAFDGGRPALKTTHRVRVELFSDSLNCPVFKQNNYTVDNLSDKINGQLTDGTFVAQVLAGSSKLNYDFNDQSSDLFKINEKGIIRLNRRPMKSEMNRNYALNISATPQHNIIGGDCAKTASTTVNVFLEDRKLTTSPTSTMTAIATTEMLTPVNSIELCDFESKIYNTEVYENLSGRHLLTKLKLQKCAGIENIRYKIHQGKTDEFVLDEITGDFYVVKPLDREKKGFHFVVVNITFMTFPLAVAEEKAVITSDADNNIKINKFRLKRQSKVSTSNPVIEFAKNKLVEKQTLIVVRVIDENDNAPVFSHLNSEGIYVFVADWQTPLLQPIARVHAVDADLYPKNLNYSLRSVKSDHFLINSTNGIISLQKSLLSTSSSVFKMEAAASDGELETRVPLTIYKLEPGINVVIVALDQSVDQVDERMIEKDLSQILTLDTNVLVKQVFVGDEGRVDGTKCHLVIYALEKLTRVPVAGDRLKKLLEEHTLTMRNSSVALSHFSGVTLPAVASSLQLSWFELIFFMFSAILVILSCFIMLFLLKCCKRRYVIKKSDTEYMMGSEKTGPRPYNVELITRKMAQNILSSRPLPNPHEEVTLTPESRATMIFSSGVHNSRLGCSSEKGLTDVNQTGSRSESDAHVRPEIYNSNSPTHSEKIVNDECVTSSNTIDATIA